MEGALVDQIAIPQDEDEKHALRNSNMLKESDNHGKYSMDGIVDGNFMEGEPSLSSSTSTTSPSTPVCHSSPSEAAAAAVPNNGGYLPFPTTDDSPKGSEGSFLHAATNMNHNTTPFSVEDDDDGYRFEEAANAPDNCFLGSTMVETTTNNTNNNDEGTASLDSSLSSQHDVGGKKYAEYTMPLNDLQTTLTETVMPTTTTTTTADMDSNTPSSFGLRHRLGGSSGGSGLRKTSFSSSNALSKLSSSTTPQKQYFQPMYKVTVYVQYISKLCMRESIVQDSNATVWIGFWALSSVTCANYVLMPMRDAVALAVGVEHIPKLTLASTVLAVFSSVPIGWLFEAPDPQRRKLWKRMGLTRGETQGTSLALYYRCFAFVLWSYAFFFKLSELIFPPGVETTATSTVGFFAMLEQHWLFPWAKDFMQRLNVGMSIAFFLIVHLMKLHALSLVWGVTTEAMEYEETARKRQQELSSISESSKKGQSRLQRMAFVGFGGTLGGILGSLMASGLARYVRLSGLLVVSALLLEVAAELAIEMGRIMQKHWVEQQHLFKSTDSLANLDPSMVRTVSMGSMKRISSGNSLSRMSELNKQSQQQANRNKNNTSSSSPNLQALSKQQQQASCQSNAVQAASSPDDNAFSQRLLRGVTTILRSRLLMAIFTYNALYASTTVLLSFQRAELVANRNEHNGGTTAEADTAFLANINMASSVAVFLLQASGMGATLAHACGNRGTLSLMPLIRFLGVLALAYWHRISNGKPPNLILFLLLDELTRVMNMAVAKPVRESLWRGLSNQARYEAKPIVDTLANRWGGGSAAFLVSFINKTLSLLQIDPGPDGVRTVFGFPPLLVLCMCMATWWAGVSADLGQIRQRIDLELKKHQ